jgi:hypothetical protein
MTQLAQAFLSHYCTAFEIRTLSSFFFYE